MLSLIGMKKLRILAAVLCLLTASSLFATPKKSKTVRVGYYENEIFQEGAGFGTVKTGYAYEYYRKLAEYTGWTYEYVYGSFSVLYGMLVNGEIDLLAGLAWKADREDIISYPKESMGHETYSLVKHDTDDMITADPATLNGRKIGVFNGAMLGALNDYLKSHGVTAEILPFDDYENLFLFFDTHKVDLFVAEGDGANERVHAKVLYTFGESDYYLCVNKKRADLLQELDTAQAMLRAEEPLFMNALRLKYFAPSLKSRAFSPMESEWVEKHNRILVGYLENYLPYSGTDKAGMVTGIVKDIVPKIFDSFGITNVTIHFTGYENYSDMVSSLVQGREDIIFPVGGGLYYAEEDGIYQSAPVITASINLVSSASHDRENDFQNPEQQNTFAVNRNNMMQYYYILNHFPQAKIVFYDSHEDCLAAVRTGAVEHTTVNGFRNELLRNRKNRSLKATLLPASDDRCFGIRIGDEGLLKILNRGVNVLGREYIQSTIAIYGQELFTYTVSDFVGEKIWIFSILSVAVGFFLVIGFLYYSKYTKEAIKAAESANLAKTSFLNNMSHEIRTPINAVLGMDEMILRESREGFIRDYAKNIQTCGKQLLGIINDILDFSKIESGKMEIVDTDYDLKLLINDVCSMVEGRALSKSLDFFVKVDEDIPRFLHGDEMKIRQCVLNLLTNAIKYTHEGSVTASFRFKKKGADRIELHASVADTGIGIKDEDIPNLQKPFTRMDQKRNRTIEGTGLGLSIVNGLLGLMGSKLDIYSVYGKGSEFSFSVEQQVRDWEKVGTVEITGDAGDSEPAVEESFQAPEARVLVVDDTAMNLKVFSGLLRHTRIQIDEALSADEGLKLARRNKYNILFIDHFMPQKDGVEMLHELRTDFVSLNHDTNCVALTANAVKGAKEYYLSEGFQSYLSKPVDAKMLEDLIESSLPELIIRKGQKGFVEGLGGGAAEKPRAEPLVTLLLGIDVEAALANCGSKEVFLEAVKVFCETSEEKAAKIERFVAENAWKDYTILVHALKSSARIIGALALSDEAKRLEACGDRAQKGEEEAADNIRDGTPALLASYRSLGARLMVLTADQNKKEGKAISIENFKDALGVIKNAIREFDFNLADDIIAELDYYEVPDGFKQRYAKVRQAIRNVDAVAALQELDKI